MSRVSLLRSVLGTRGFLSSGLMMRMADAYPWGRFFEYYRDVACTTYPVVGDTHQLESKINQMLQNRALAGRSFVPDSDVDGIFGMTMSWVGLFFAVLASGAQSSMLAHKERELTSQVYSKSCFVAKVK